MNTETIQKIQNNIQLLKKVVHAGHLANAMHAPHKLYKDAKLKTIKRSIEGQIQFVKRIEQKNSPNYQQLKKLYKKGLNLIKNEFGLMPLSIFNYEKDSPSI